MDLRGAQDFIERVKLVRTLVVDRFNAGIYEHLQTMNAGRMGNVDRGVFDARAVLRSLRDRVDVRMDRPEAVLLGIPVRGL